ncbi:protein NPGR2-like [Salvia splendens]|uniref:protein NPGR2-like n=1 Tax=Salvia splendens TaxID=180675 RepID=UPI00110471AA|nr:protein NPGR2-like [Salvia splendens]XP_042017796.1 protein NPGR2-like [Salvia splendens]XP_042017797.1 protein NPGR2-like [Salvia splendens]XP_042017798.1 protein NPGR2-like [Salvia splendens]XP_042017799.1 protein NPGR2-like [Salvia splendens]XP_042017801.1 protein NPGR2-like [Salvia splendens]
MRNEKQIGVRLGKTMQCICSGERLHVFEMVTPSLPEDSSASVHSSQPGEAGRKPDTGNIEEAETSLRESGSLNYEEARALLGRYEYQKGNIEAALHVFEGIDIAAITPKIKITLSANGETNRRRSQNYAASPMSIHAVSLLFEAVFLKAKSLQALGRYKESAQSCSVILDIVESSLPAALPENFGADCKLQETLNKAVELLPELWKLVDSPRDAVLSYRRALLNHWNLDAQTTAKIQKEFAVFLLYSGIEAIAPNLRHQMENAFIPKNNIEEAILLLMILLRKVSLKRIEWDPSILDHLSYALSMSGGLEALANQIEELLPGVIDRKERYHILALCYHGKGDDMGALNLWKKVLKTQVDSTYLSVLLFISKICGGKPKSAGEGINFSQIAIDNLHSGCDQLMGVAECMLGISLSTYSRSVATDTERVQKQSKALESLEIAGRFTKLKDPFIIYHLSLEYAEQRKLDAALHHAKNLLKLESGSNIRGWILLARILSAQKSFSNAETIINAALDQTGIWDQGELLRSKAKLQLAQGLVKEAIETSSQLLAVLQVQLKSVGLGKKLKENHNHIKNLELDTWLGLASIYIKLSRWHDAELCLSKSETITAFSASRWHATGLLQEAKGDEKEALKAYSLALEIDPTHVPSLVSKAKVLSGSSCRSQAIIRSFLTEALRLDHTNASAWHQLGLLHKDGEDSLSALEAAECFEAAAVLQETEPVEPFR